MRRSPNLKANSYRVRKDFGRYNSTDALGNYGMFRVPLKTGAVLRCIVSEGSSPGDGEAFGWEHVSVSVEGNPRTPTWDEMCAVKNLFWRDDETVVQFHPAKNEYVSDHPYTLHLWRRLDDSMPLPPRVLISDRPVAEVPHSSPDLIS